MAFDSFAAIDADTRRLRAAMTVPPPPGRLWVIDQTIRQLKQHGIWQKLDVLWMLAAHDAQAARLNWKNPSQFALTAVNSPTFTADRGYAGNGTTSYLNSGYVPSTSAINMSQNSCAVVGYSRTSLTAGLRMLGGAQNDSGPDRAIYLNPRFTGDVLLARANDANLSTLACTSSVGWFGKSRTGATTSTDFVNANSQANAGASSGLPAVDICICASNSNTGARFHSTMEASIFSVAGGLSDAAMQAWRATSLTYLNRVGAA